MDSGEAGNLSPVANEAAAALVAALRQTAAGDGAWDAALEVAFGADPMVAHCSIAVGVDGGHGDGSICSSGNLLQAHDASSLQCAASSLAGMTMAQRRPRLLHGRLLPRRHVMEDAAAILSESSAVQTLVCLPLLWPPHSGGAVRTAIGALTVGYASPPTAAALRRALLVAQALAQEQRAELRSFADMVSSMLQPQRLHGSAAGPASAASGSDSGQGLFDSEWGWSSSAGSDVTAASSDDGAGGRGALGRRGSSASGAVPAAGWAQHPLSLRFQAAEVEAQFGRYQAACLQRVDALAYLFVLLLFGFEVALPLRLGAWAGSPDEQPPSTGSLLALLPGLLPGLLLLHPRTHVWFSAHRDHLLLGTWLYTAYTAYSRVQLSPRQLLSWLGVLGLALPMRFFRLLPITLLVSLQMLHVVSLRQLVHAAVLPLAASWWFEAHSRAAFVHQQHRRWRSRRRQANH